MINVRHLQGGQTGPPLVIALGALPSSAFALTVLVCLAQRPTRQLQAQLECCCYLFFSWLLAIASEPLPVTQCLRVSHSASIASDGHVLGALM